MVEYTGLGKIQERNLSFLFIHFFSELLFFFLLLSLLSLYRLNFLLYFENKEIFFLVCEYKFVEHFVI